MNVTELTPDMLSGGYSITRGGQYKISENVRFFGFLGLDIAASNVALNLGSYIVRGSMLTNAVIRIRRGQRNINVSGGHVKGGINTVVIGNACKNIDLENLHVSGFYFAGIVIRASNRITLTSCSIGRAASAPATSLFGIVALPSGGFTAASQIMNGDKLSDAKATGGDGLTMHRVEISDITPLNCLLLPDLNEAEPNIVTLGGFIQNTTCPRPLQTLNLTNNLQRMASVLGSAYSEEIALLEREIDFVDLVELAGVGIHAYSTFNWKSVVGISSELTVELPSFLPKEFKFRRTDFGSAWGTRSAMLIKNTLISPEVDEEILRESQLSKVPLGVTYVQISQQSSIVGPFIPGAMGSSVML